MRSPSKPFEFHLSWACFSLSLCFIPLAFFPDFSFLFCVSLHAFHLCFTQRTRGVGEGGQEGAKPEETVREEQKVKEEMTSEDGRGKEITETCDEERLREPGEEGKAQDAPEPGGEREPWRKEHLQKSLSQDDDDDR